MIPQKKKAITEGDAKVKMIQTLFYIKTITDSLCKVIIEYENQLKGGDYCVIPIKIISIFHSIKSTTMSLNEGIFELCPVSRRKIA